jgi:hypothetical protein
MARTFLASATAIRTTLGVSCLVALLVGCSAGTGDDPTSEAELRRTKSDDKKTDIKKPGAPDLSQAQPGSGFGSGSDSPFGTAAAAGQIPVTLRPTEVVTAGQSKVVTFGVPFPRGVVVDPTMIRVKKANAEIPAFVEIASPWRSATNAAIDGKSIRVAKVQINYTFTSASAAGEQITVEWGAKRTANIAIKVPTRSGWHKVTSGTFASTDNVEEPDVYATMPKTWLTATGITLPTRAIEDAVPERRMDPTQALSQTPNNYTRLDFAMNNFFFTTINQDDSRVTAADNLMNYRADYEPWLYDKAGTYFQGYIRSGFFTHLREAVRAADFYKKHIYTPTTPGIKKAVIGMFDLKVDKDEDYPGGNGAMYSYAEPLAYTYWLTGDDTAMEALPWIADAQTQSEDTRWSAGAGAWTERHTAFALLANTIAYEVTGQDRYKRSMLKAVDDFVWHQDGAGGQIPAHVDGGLFHTAEQHGDGDGWVASPWMSALTMNAMARTYMMTEDTRIARFAVRLANFQMAASRIRPPSGVLYETTQSLRTPDYITMSNGEGSELVEDDIEHALDVGASIAWGAYFAEKMGQSATQLKKAADELFTSYSVGVDYFTRPNAPAEGKTAYRISPPRKYGWQYHNTGSFRWLMDPAARATGGAGTGSTNTP